MTAPVADLKQEPERRSRRRTVAGLIAVVLVAAAAITCWQLSVRYNPLGSGEFAAPYGSTAALRGGGPVHTLAAVGSTLVVDVPLDNNGGHAVTIRGIDAGDGIVRAQWAPLVLVPGGAVSGEPRPSQAFPARIPSHGRIILRLTVQQPTCSQHGTNDPMSGLVSVRWTALVSSHRTDLDTGLGTYLMLCP